MTTPAIQVDHVTKEFRFREQQRDSLKERFVRGRGGAEKTFKAVDDVSFDVAQGKTFGLVGHNGSGKSTMLKMLAGVYRPTSGSIKVRGQVSALLELGAGFHGELTGRENIYLNGSILGLSNRQIQESIDQIVDFADIGGFIDVPVKTYSSGMYVRLGFAIAVTLSPEVLIVDEIIAVGDEAFQRKGFDHLYELRRQGSTILLVTHSLGIARELCDDGLWLDKGRAKMIGPIGEVIDAYVADVNREEEARIDSLDSQLRDLPRRGSGEARIVRLEILNRQGKPEKVLHPGGDYTIRFHISATTDLDSVGAGLAFTTENGFLLSGPNSDRENKFYDIPRGESFIDFHIPSFQFQPGVYSLTASLGSQGHVWDFVDRGWHIVVRSDHPVNEPGPVRAIGHWSASTDHSLLPSDQRLLSSEQPATVRPTQKG